MRIYLDHNATTPLHPHAMQAVTEACIHAWGNASSLHQEGREARQVIEVARKQVAALIGAHPEEMVFTSGGTEANNAALWGITQGWLKQGQAKAQIITSPLEHPSVKAAVQFLSDQGWPVHFLRVDQQGTLDLDDLASALQRPTCLVSLSLCNHELGNIYPIAVVAEQAHRAGALVHCDAVQAVGRMPVDVTRLPVDTLTFSAHKMHGPKGIAALYISSRLPPARFPAFLLGGKQEKGRRAGTESAPLAAGFGVAAELACAEMAERSTHVAHLRAHLEAGLLAIPGARLFGNPDFTQRAPGTCNVGFKGVDGSLLMIRLDLNGVAVSTGSACSSGSNEPSPVIQALGFSKPQATTAVRFSIGYTNTLQEIQQVLRYVEHGVEHIRSVVPGGPSFLNNAT